MKKLLISLLLLPTIAFGAVTFPVNGGTGTSTKPTFGQLLMGNSSGLYNLVSTSSLGITASVASSTIWAMFSGTSPITFNSGTGAIGCTTATGSVTGCLSSTDYNIFNGKLGTTSAGTLFPTFTYASSTYGLIAVANTWTALNTFNGGLSFGNGTSTNTFNFLTATGTNLFSTFATTSKLFSTNGTFTQATTTAFSFTNATGTVLSLTHATSTNFFGTSIGGTSSSVTNATSTTGWFSSLLSALTASFTTLNVSGITTLATSTVNGSFSVNGNIISRVVGYTSSSTITINADTTNIATTTINQTTTFANPTGTIIDGQMFEIIAMATGTRTISWGTNFASSTDLAAPLTVASGTTRILYEYRLSGAKWDLVGLLKIYP